MAGKSTSQTISNGSGNGGEIQQITAFQRLVARMSQMATVDVEGANFKGDDLNAILEAETEEEFWDADERGPIDGKKLVDCEILIHDFQVKFSRGGNGGGEEMQGVFKNDAGKSMYLLVTSTRVSTAGEKRELRLPGVGEQFVWNTSARFLVAKIMKAAQMGWIDPTSGKALECVVKGIDLGDGQTVLKLRPMPKRVHQG